LRDAKGEISGVIAIINDITEHKKAEAKLRRSQQFNQQVITNASEGIVVYDRELRCVVWNPVMEELSGLASDLVLGRRILDLAPHWRDLGLREMLHQVLQGDTVEAPDFQIDPYHDRWVASRYSPLVDKDDQCIGIIGILTEVTARRQAEEALRESQQFNQQVIDGSPNGIAVYDRELRVVVWNPAMEALLETHRAHVLGQHILEVFPHLAETESPRYWQRALAGETISEREFQFHNRTDKWVSASYVPLCNPRGEIVGLIITVRDVTARKLAEEALQASQQFNQQIITNAREGILVYDNSLRYLLWNPAMEELSGMSAETILGQHALEVDPEAATNGIYLSLQAAARGETPPRYDYEYIFPAAGKRGFCSRQDAPLRDEHGVIVGVISVLSEITDRKRAEEELRESKQFNQEIVANAREGFVVYDRDFKIKIWNAAMEEFSGLAAAEVLGKDIYEVFPQIRESALPKRLAEALAGKTVVGKDFQMPAKGKGKARWLSARYGPHRNSRGEIVGVIVTIRDVTARRNIEEQLRLSEERYREILATLQDGYWELTLSGEMFFFNEAILTIFGRSDAELTRDGYIQFITEATRQRGQAILRQVQETGEPVKSYEFEIIRPDGEVRTLESSVGLIRRFPGHRARCDRA
jgi:PAS domain S-box-containing protein